MIFVGEVKENRRKTAHVSREKCNFNLDGKWKTFDVQQKFTSN